MQPGPYNVVSLGLFGWISLDGAVGVGLDARYVPGVETTLPDYPTLVGAFARVGYSTRGFSCAGGLTLGIMDYTPSGHLLLAMADAGAALAIPAEGPHLGPLLGGTGVLAPFGINANVVAGFPLRATGEPGPRFRVAAGVGLWTGWDVP